MKRQRGLILNPFAYAPDPLFASVSLLLPVTESAGATTWADASTFAHTTARQVGNEVTEANSPFPGQCRSIRMSSGATNGAVRVLGDATSLTMGTGDFTWECWYWMYGLPASFGYLMFNGDSTSFTGRSGMTLGVTAQGGNAWFNNQTATAAKTGSNTSGGSWQFQAASRTGTQLSMYLGTLGGAASCPLVGTRITNSVNLPLNPNFAVGGCSTGPLSVQNCSITQVRVTKGVGRYPATCPLPIAPFPTS